MKEIQLFIDEDNEILRESFIRAFSGEQGISVVGVGMGEEEADETAIARISMAGPDVLLLGVKDLGPRGIDKLESIRRANPHIRFVILCGYYNAEGANRLREFLRGSSGGCACLLKYSVKTVDQLSQIIRSVGEGTVILDPGIMGTFIGDRSSSILSELSPRELEILSLIAKGYNNSTISEVLYLELKTVERHINRIYSKVNATEDDSQQARVHVALMYLKATGQLLSGPPAER